MQSPPYAIILLPCQCYKFICRAYAIAKSTNLTDLITWLMLECFSLTNQCYSLPFSVVKTYLVLTQRIILLTHSLAAHLCHSWKNSETRWVYGPTNLTEYGIWIPMLNTLYFCLHVVLAARLCSRAITNPVFIFQEVKLVHNLKLAETGIYIYIYQPTRFLQDYCLVLSALVS